MNKDMSGDSGCQATVAAADRNGRQSPPDLRPPGNTQNHSRSPGDTRQADFHPGGLRSARNITGIGMVTSEALRDLPNVINNSGSHPSKPASNMFQQSTSQP